MPSQSSRHPLRKGALIGGIVGLIAFFIAPLGLGIAFIEMLKPVLIPGVVFIVNPYFIPAGTTEMADTTHLMILGILFNVLIFALVGLLIAAIFRGRNNAPQR